MERAQTAAVAAKILGEFSTTIVDVGARWGAEGAWWRIKPLAELVGFDPDPEECARLNRFLPVGAHERYVPLALGETERRARFYETEEPACSSLYPPDAAMAARFPGLRVLKVMRTGDVDLTTLDDWAREENTSEITFIKLDTQGSELNILKGGEEALAECLGLEIEVQFAPIYHGSPVFSEIDEYLRGRGFVLWRLNEMCHYSERCTGVALVEESADYSGLLVNRPAGNGRLTWCNALYFKDFRSPAVLSGGPRKLLILASLLDAKGDVDGAVCCLQLVLEHHSDVLDTAARDSIGFRLQQLLKIVRRPLELVQLRERVVELERQCEAMQGRLEEVEDVGPHTLRVARGLKGVVNRFPRLAARAKRLFKAA